MPDNQPASPEMQTQMPTVSVVLPVHNAAAYLEATLDSLCAQTYRDLDIVVVDDGSTDASAEIVEKRRETDSRIRLLKRENGGAGAARNAGLQEAAGDYVVFLDADDLFDPELVSKSLAKAIETEADVVAFNFVKFNSGGVRTNAVGIHANWLPAGTAVFSWRDCPDRILSIVNPTPWNKLYRRSFLVSNGLRFEEISSSNDITFAAVSVAAASRIAWLPDALVHYRTGEANTITSTKTRNLRNVIVAVESVVRQVRRLPHGPEIWKSVQRFVIENYSFSLSNYVTDLSDESQRAFYSAIHETLAGPDFDDVQPDTFADEALFRVFLAIRRNSVDEYVKRTSLPLIASLTSWPGRIHAVSASVATLLAQTRKPDRILLWLAKPQFPGGEADLPEELLALVRSGDLELRWCDDDLKPHKKYFYTIREFPDALVATFDDDLLYPRSLVENLVRSYLAFPDAVSTARANLITLQPSGEPQPYAFWIKAQNCFILQPSFLLLAGTGSGTVFPPGILPEETFDALAIKETCLFADDLWLKGMELLAGIPVVQISRALRLAYVPGSQDVGLCKQNINEGQNDAQLARLRGWIESSCGEKGLMQNRLSRDPFYSSFCAEESLFRLLLQDRKLSLSQEAAHWRQHVGQQQKRISHLKRISRKRRKQMSNPFRFPGRLKSFFQIAVKAPLRLFGICK